MHTRRFGATRLSVTPIGLGLAAIGRPAYITAGRDADLGADRSEAALERRSHDVLDAAYDAGIRYFDAARSYGRAEEFLAAWLDRRVPDDVTVGSKWGYTYVGDWRLEVDVHEVKDHSLAALRRQYAESRALLGDRLDLYQVHSATLESGVLDDPAVLGELAGLRTEGIEIGLSVSGPRQAEVIERALRTEIDGSSPFSAVQATYNVLEPSAGPALASAHRAGWGVIVKEAVANGRLTDRTEGPERSVLERIARGRDASIDQLAIAAVLAEEWVDVVLSGAVTTAQLDSNARALDLDWSARERAELDRVRERPEDYWAARSALPWA